MEAEKQYKNINFSKTSDKLYLSELEISQIKKYESKFNLEDKEKNFENEITYWDSVFETSTKKVEYVDGLVPNKKTLYKNFLIAYKFLNGFDFVLNDETIRNIEPIIKYFSFEPSFFDCENSIKQVGRKFLEPSFEKGLLLIGNVGNGKSSVMKAMEFMIDYYFEKSLSEKWNTAGDWNNLRFKFKTTESLVTEYEFLSSGQEKEMFFNKYSKGGLFLDDLKREKDASNFGITNVIKSILEKRYNNQKFYTKLKGRKPKTFGTMNFHEKHENDISKSIEECGIRYGSHIYDRIFEMFNIIEFKGKSFRN